MRVARGDDGGAGSCNDGCYHRHPQEPAPWLPYPSLDRLACAAAVLFGRYGDVTRLAQRHGLCRQAVYRQADAVLDDLDGLTHRQEALRLRQQLDQLQARCDDLQRRLDSAVVIDDDRQAEFAATAQAEGVSLPVARRLLQVVASASAPPAWPSSAAGPRPPASGPRALLAALDEFTRPRVRQAVADEIFVRRRPILMVCEPGSLCWVSGRLAARRDGAHLGGGVRPAAGPGAGHQGRRHRPGQGLEQVNAQRQQQGLTAVAEQDDHFHACARAARPLRGAESVARRALEKADKAQRGLKRPGNYGYRKTGRATVVAKLWRQAERAFDAWGREERAWQRVAAALTPVRRRRGVADAGAGRGGGGGGAAGPGGAALGEGAAALARPQLWTYLDRAQEQLAALPVAAELREAAVQVEGLRRRPEALRGEGPSAGGAARRAAGRGVGAVAGGPGGGRGAGAGARGAGRGVAGEQPGGGDQQRAADAAGAAPEGDAGAVGPEAAVLELSPLPDGEAAAAGARTSCWGVTLPPLPWWELLKRPPEELRQQLSAQQVMS